ncbi:hypothetical protein J6TS2_43730 [Heyndrickxia sporothermodurans]|nr:hypothetical protein J6TS2_43730 [Heyndrickxia sporothermodurans]
MDIAYIIIWSVLILYFLIMIPIQYSCISSMKELQKESNLTHNERFEKMTFEEEQLHYHLQSNFFTLPSNIIAMLIYKIRHRKEKVF